MSTYAFQYSYDAAGNRVKQVKDGVSTFYSYDAANQLLESRDHAAASAFHFFGYDANGSMEKDSKVETSGQVLLDCQYEGTTDGADGEEATESGTITYESGELPGTEAVRVAVDGGGTGTVSYGTTGCLADGEGTILLRVKNDDWDSGIHTTQYLLELWLDATHYIRIWLDASAGVLHADGRDASKTWALEADASEWLDGSWYDIVLAYATRDERLYVNGAQEDSAAAKDMPTGLTDIYMGADSGGSNHWYGLVDEFLTFDSALPATEIANLSNRTGGASNTTYFEYADNGLVKKITPTSGSPTQFYYDARMQRYAIDWAGTVSYYQWDGMNQLVEKDANLSTVAQHTHGQTPIEGIGSVVTTKRSGEYQYPHYDHRGSLFDLEDTGAADLEAEYNAWGEELSRTGAAVTRFGYQGTAWMRLPIGADVPLLSPTRIDRPALGRFLQRDLLRLWIRGMYTYCGDNPMAGVDARGLFQEGLLRAIAWWAGVQAKRKRPERERISNLGCVMRNVLRSIRELQTGQGRSTGTWREEDQLEFSPTEYAEWEEYVEKPATYFLEQYGSAREWDVRDKVNFINTQRGNNPVFSERLLIRRQSLMGLGMSGLVEALDTLVHEPQHDWSQRWMGHRGDWDVRQRRMLERATDRLNQTRPTGGECCCETPPNKDRRINTLWQETLCRCKIPF